jgi:nicotinamide riboside transporter PnuC
MDLMELWKRSYFSQQITLNMIFPLLFSLGFQDILYTILFYANVTDLKNLYMFLGPVDEQWQAFKSSDHNDPIHPCIQNNMGQRKQPVFLTLVCLDFGLCYHSS